jgi:WD40 repeat protein
MGVGVFKSEKKGDELEAVSASDDHTLKVWNVASGHELRTLRGHTGGVWSVAVTPEGSCVISGSEDHSLRIWDLKEGAEIHRLTGHTGGILSVAITPDASQAISASEDHTLRF